MKTVIRVKKHLNPGLKVDRILLTMTDSRTNYSKDITRILHETYDGKLRIFTSSIPLSVRASETSAEGTSILYPQSEW